MTERDRQIRALLGVEKVSVSHVDTRGVIKDLLPRGGVVRHVGLLTAVPGSVRGNHRHVLKDEWFVLLRGAATAALRAGGGHVYTFPMEPDDRVYVPRGTTHAYYFHEHSEILDLGSEEFDPTDCERDEILGPKGVILGNEH